MSLIHFLTAGYLDPIAVGRREIVVTSPLDVTTVGASDLTEDGRWLAVITSSRRDALGTDFARDGDPTYVAPRKARVEAARPWFDRKPSLAA